MLKKLVVLVSLLFLVACGAEQVPQENVSINLPMGYIPDPQFAPFYVALEKGYFADAGFDVSFDYSFETDGVALVGAGERPFALASGEQILLARAQDVPVVYITEWYQKYPIALVSKSTSGINSPADLAGRTVGIPGFWGASYVGYAGLLGANDLTQADLTTEEIGFTQYEAVLTDQVEAAVVYTNNEPVRLAASGEDINVIDISAYVDMVASGIITNEAMIADNPEQVQAFVSAFMRGLNDTLADPAAAIEISGSYIEALDDSGLSVLEASIPLWESAQLGATTADSWETTQSVLQAIDFMDAPLADLDGAYTNQFVEGVE